MSKQDPSRRHHGTGSIYVKHGSYYGRWRIAGRRVNRRLGLVREPGTRDGMTKRAAEATLRRMIGEVPPPRARPGHGRRGRRAARRAARAQGAQGDDDRGGKSTVPRPPGPALR